MQVTVTNDQFTGCSKMYCVTHCTWLLQCLHLRITLYPWIYPLLQCHAELHCSGIQKTHASLNPGWISISFLMLSSRQLLLIQTLSSSHPRLILKCRDNHHTQISRMFTFLCHQLSSCHVQSTNQNTGVLC